MGGVKVNSPGLSTFPFVNLTKGVDVETKYDPNENTTKVEG